MSSAHRPTWAPAVGKESRGGTKILLSRDIASHTKLKFRQPGQGGQTEVARRDLKLELLTAEREAAARKAAGHSGFVADPKLLLLQNEQQHDASAADDAAARRRRILAEAAVLDRDEDGGAAAGSGKGKGKAQEDDDDDDEEEEEGEEESEEESSDEDDEEDETAELLRELEKIKRERAEEKERIEREKAASEQTSREEEIATGNPLLNLQSAMGYSASPTPSSSSLASSSFGVKRRWDDDVIFKNQARGVNETPKKEFVNDLLRTEFHKKFLKKFIA